MPLKLRLRPNEKIIVNGAVIVSEHGGTELTFLNQARILREDDVITPQSLADGGPRSSTSQLYFVIQLLYIDPDQADRYMPMLADAVAAVRAERPGQDDEIDRIIHLLADGFLYRALRACREAFADCLPGTRTPTSTAKTNEDDMANGYAGGYDQPPATDDPRALEAWALTRVSGELEDGLRHPEETHLIREALRRNQMLWTIFQSAVSERQTPLSDELRQSILSLSYAVDRKTFQALGDHNPETIRFLVGINRNIAMGLLGSPENGAVADSDRPAVGAAAPAPADAAGAPLSA